MGFLRLFHWGLVITLGISWLTAELGVEYREYHLYSGYTAAGLLIFRLIWGIIGPGYARFSQFVRGPGAVVSYVRARVANAKTPTAYPGHSPLGALAVVAMLLLIAAQVTTGMFADDDILYTGPWREAVSSSLAGDLTAWHHKIFDMLLWLAGLHIAAIAFYRSEI